MIPPTWQPVTRPEDGEHVGYLVPDGAELVVPTTLLGTPAGPAGAPTAAAAQLRTAGLALLDRRWWCRLPDPLPPGLTEARTPSADWPWRPVVVVEASPTGCTVRLEMAAPEELRGRAALPVPVGGLLRTDPPAW